MHTSINGELVLNQEAKLLITDLSIQRAYGIFDFFRTSGNQPLFLEDHLDRFYYSATQMHLLPVISRNRVKELIDHLVKKNNFGDSGIRITLTGGYSEDGYTLPSTSNLLITQSPLSINKDNFYAGASLICYDHQRQLPEIKTIDYLMAIYLQPYIKANNADDVLYYHQNEITECPRANFFVVNRNDEVITPSKNILKGITRKRILAFTEFDCKERAVTMEDVAQAKEAFITSTTRLVLPVFYINGKTIGNGKPGLVTTALFHKLVANQA